MWVNTKKSDNSLPSVLYRPDDTICGFPQSHLRLVRQILPGVDDTTLLAQASPVVLEYHRCLYGRVRQQLPACLVLPVVQAQTVRTNKSWKLSGL